MTPFSLPAPAKINLFLHILGRLPNGYHRLQTVFQLLDYGDTLHFEQAEQLILEAPAALAGDDNLILRAARALQQHSGQQQGVRIRLDKKLPAGGGLGGGSSNAATTLLALNQLWQLGLSLDALATIGLTLGADVPVFVHGRSAWADGIGEQLEPLNLPQKTWLVIFPDVAISTAAIFSDPSLTRDTPESKVATFLGAASKAAFRNDCEAVAKRLFPAVSHAINWLQERAGNARLTGTGACVFAEVPSRDAGERLLLQLPAHWQGFVAGGLNTSPVHQALAALR